MHADGFPRRASLLVLSICKETVMFISRIEVIDDSVAALAIPGSLLVAVFYVGDMVSFSMIIQLNR